MTRFIQEYKDNSTLGNLSSLCINKFTEHLELQLPCGSAILLEQINMASGIRYVANDIENVGFFPIPFRKGYQKQMTFL